VLWLRVTHALPASAADLVALLNAMAAAFRIRFGPNLSVHWSSTNQRAVWHTSPTDEIGVDGTDVGSGAVAGDSVTANVAVLIDWSIAGTYRGGHPRTYLAGMPESDLENNSRINPVPLAALQTASAGFLSDVNALTAGAITRTELGTVAFFRLHSALAPPVFKPYLAAAVKKTLATQRRRMRR